MIQKPGIYPGISWEEYSRWDGRRSSELKNFKRSPLHAHYFSLHPPAPSRSQEIGTAIHAAVLEPETFEQRYVCKIDPGDRRSPINKAKWQAFLSENAGKGILSEEIWETVMRVRAAVWSQRWAEELLSGSGANELSIRWEDEESKLLCKGRIDRYCGGGVVDLKTGNDVSKDAFMRAISNYDYHLQAALYLDGLDTLEPHPRSWTWVTVETSPPYAAALYEPSDEMLEEGRRRYRSALMQWAHCAREGYWFGYPEHPQMIDLPPWAKTKASEGEDDVF
jgi:hypothetical protein